MWGIMTSFGLFRLMGEIFGPSILRWNGDNKVREDRLWSDPWDQE